MHITLILSASPNDPLRKRDPIAPLSLPLLAACVPEHDYTILDMLWDDQIPYDKPTDLVGISVRLHAQEYAYSVAREYRNKGVKVVLGGPQISAEPFMAKQHADGVVIGEGEPLWPRIVEDTLHDSLKSFYVCSPKPFEAKGHPVYQHYSYADLNRTPFANRSLLPRSYTFDSIFAVRGCPVNCDFCSVTELFGSSYRKRPVKAVLKEIQTLGKYFYLLDDTVFGRKQLYPYYLSLYSKLAKIKKKRYWMGQANLDAAASSQGRAVIRQAAKAGLMYAAVGLESVNLQTLQTSGALKKSGTESSDYLKNMKENVRFLHKQGVFVSGWFVVGYQSDCRTTWRECLKFARQTGIFPVVFPVKALPGTRLYKRVLSEGNLLESYRIAHHQLDEKTITEEMQHIKRKGHSLFNIAINTIRFAVICPRQRLRRSLFALITQLQLRKGIDILNKSFWKETG
ncbi:MAG: B12-binding domain-containing radical SAM protein [Fibrobacterota bacterium]